MDPNEINLLISKLQSGQITPDELERLKHALKSSSELKDLLKSMDAGYDSNRKNLDTLPAYANQEKTKLRLLSSIQQQNIEKIEKRSFPWKSISMLVAASLLLAGFLFLFNKKDNTQTLVWETISTKHGERKQFELADKTVIQLNGNSSLSYVKNPQGNLRLVKLKGEAFFDVAKDPNKPFIIISKDFTTRVVGTSFNIDSDIEKSIGVSTGKVKVFQILQSEIEQQLSKQNKQLSQFLEENTGSHADLVIGQKATLKGKNWELGEFNDDNWRMNQLIHINESLSSVLKKVYRFYGDSVLSSERLQKSKITISFKNKNIEQVLKTLAEINNAKLMKKTEKTWEIKDN